MGEEVLKAVKIKLWIENKKNTSFDVSFVEDTKGGDVEEGSKSHKIKDFDTKNQQHCTHKKRCHLNTLSVYATTYLVKPSQRFSMNSCQESKLNSQGILAQINPNHLLNHSCERQLSFLSFRKIFQSSEPDMRHVYVLEDINQSYVEIA